MNKFLKQVFILLALLSSINIIAHDNNIDTLTEGLIVYTMDTFNYSREEAIDFLKPKKNIFKPKFSLGSGIYTLIGDIQNEENGFLKGQAGFNAGMKFDIYKNLDLSFLLFKKSFSANNDFENFSSDIDGIGIHLGYILNPVLKHAKIKPVVSLGVQRLSVSTVNIGKKIDRFNVFSIPLGFGLRMDVTERLQFDMAINFAMGMGDIDMSSIEENSDGYKSLNFSIHYDLFTTSKNKDNHYLNDDYYMDVNFTKLESEDEDGDLVVDIDDYCPNTPVGVRVDKNGCPLDDDKDGIANYLDKQKNTPEGVIVDKNGVGLTDDQFKSMYSDLEAATRRYANFYNELEIKRENYKTIDEYLIAKANAFNKAFYESVYDEGKVSNLVYKIKLGEFQDGIPAKIINQMLSIDDLESFVNNDGVVIYTVGSYYNLDEALSRLYSVEEDGFDDTYILVDNNGELSEYVQPIVKVEINEDEVVVSPEEEEINNDEVVEATDEMNEKADLITNEKKVNNEITYRIQLGAYNEVLSDAVFVGVDDVISFTGKDGLIRYLAGSFDSYNEAIDYQAQMKARGHQDAFIVTYKDGKRIGLNIAINSKIDKQATQNKNKELQFTVQIMVGEATISADKLLSIGKLGNFDKKATGSKMYEYYAGTYLTLEEANIQLEKAKDEGFSDAFIFATQRGNRIPLNQAIELLKE
tara:strand:- start:1882 stop:3963 length:2082 start_codon:yes stop_codon:yes gene_type:complete